MCHISYRETIVRSIQRKPGTARGRGWEGRSMRRGGERESRSMLISSCFSTEVSGTGTTSGTLSHSYTQRGKKTLPKGNFLQKLKCTVPKTVPKENRFKDTHHIWLTLKRLLCYYNSGLIFQFWPIIPITHNNIVPSKLKADIWKGNNMLKDRKCSSENQTVCKSANRLPLLTKPL